MRRFTGIRAYDPCLPAYEAIAPDCPSQAGMDFADLSSNNEQSNLGCAVRSNLAAMIADPADLLGTRALDKGDPIRRGVILEKFREGESTGSHVPARSLAPCLRPFRTRAYDKGSTGYAQRKSAPRVRFRI